MSMDLSTLVDGQNDLQQRIAKAVTNLKKLGSGNITLDAVETRMRLLDHHWSEFDAQHKLVRAAYKDKYAESDYAKNEFYDLAEVTYLQQRSTLAGYANQLRPAPPAPPPAAAPIPPINAPQNGHADDRSPKTALPRIKLPQFSGSYKEWPTFRDLFLSVIGENKAISDVERFHYLRSCVQGPAETLISSLALTGDNYQRAWKLLSKHYENRREIIRANFSTFASLQKMKSDTSEELERIYNGLTTVINGQESIGRPIESHGMDLLNYLVVELFDTRTRLEWESATCDSNDPPSHEKLLDFISKRVLTLNAARPKVTSGDTSATSRQLPRSSATSTVRTAKSHFTARSNEPQCPVCKAKHSVRICDTFRAKPAAERKAIVEANKLCFNCLGTHLVSRCQSSRNCFTCQGRHHTMLHDACSAPRENEVHTLSAVRRVGDNKAILLATARVYVADQHGELHKVRVLIDQGSEVSIATESLVQRLRLPRSRTTTAILGIGGTSSGSARGKVSLSLSSPVTSAKIQVTAFVLPRLSLYEGSAIEKEKFWPHLQGIALADPQYFANDPVELLLGAEVYSAILENGLCKGKPQTPIAQKTSFGWILSGGCDTTTSQSHRHSLQVTVDTELATLVHRFWEQEADTLSPAAPSPEAARCEEHYANTHSRDATGRYMVRLPFASSPVRLTETRRAAERLLASMERKSRLDPRFGTLYRDFMAEYESLGHMEQIPATEILNTNNCYLPHHGVIREASTTTKLRVVFNGSQKIPSGESLNSLLHVGENLLPPLADVLSRWRRHRYVFVADIEKMYRQIRLHPEDRDFQRVLWRPSEASEIREFRLNTVTYGLASAPFLAIRTLRQLADDEESRFPLGAVALRRDCYVDDVVTGASTLPDAVALLSQLRDLCMAGGFPLRKWAANNDEILREIPMEHRASETARTWEQECHSTLGLRWHPHSDTFSFTIHPRECSTFTKRRVLAETARLFDPLGWLAPVIIRAKIMIQSTWLSRLDWDTPLPNSDARLWAVFLRELPLLSNIRVQRWVGCDNNAAHLELHGFADASERGYAAAVYLRVSTDDCNTLHILAAKTKVAPIKQISLPRLELCAASLLVRVVTHVQSCMSLNSTPVHLWSDSQVTLHWIRGHASRWKTFVANRVSQIQQRLPDAHWRHIAGKDNPADCASRGVSPGDLVDHPLWWTGPAWILKDRTHWPSSSKEIPDDELPERRVITTAHSAAIKAEPEMLRNFSTLTRLLRCEAR